MRPLLISAFLFIGCFASMPQTNEPPKNSPDEVMREMRLKQLTMSPKEFGQKPTPDYPRVCAMLMDWPIGNGTVTAVARNTGDASVYTTGTFGVIGGIGHERVSSAAKSCVTVAERHFDDATATKKYPYPEDGRVRFYLVGYDEVRVIDRDLESLRTGKDKCSDLYEAAQRVVTELRLTAEQQNRKKP
jgi:hypothetical protein